MHHLSTKSLVAAVAAAALLGSAAPAAVAAPKADKPAHTAKADKVDARVDRALARIADSRKLANLDAATQALVEANLTADAALDAAGLRPSTYRQIINQLAFAERLLAAATDNAEATTAVTATVGKLVTFTAGTDKAELRLTKRELQVWAELLEDETEEPAEPEELVTPTV